MRFAKLVLLLSLTVLLSPALALSTMRVPAIDANQEGLLTEISVSAVHGTGKISVDISPLISVDTQESIKTAAKVAARLANKSLSDYDLHITINAAASSVDGPSGGAAIAVLAYAELSRKQVRPDATITAAIAEDGRLSSVGGVKEKLDAALEDGITLLVLAKGQSVGDDFDYVVYADQLSNGSLQVVEAADAEEAVQYLFTAPATRIPGAPLQGIPPLSVENVSPSEASAPLKKLAENEISVLNETYSAFLAQLAGSGKNLSAVVGSDAAAQAVEKSIEKALKNARLLLDAGYYYSAANTAFLASVTIESLAARNKNEQEFGEMLDALWNEVDSTEFVAKTTANLEWVAAAELRYHWAKWKLQAIEESLEAGGSSVQSLASEYAAAKVWLEAAKRMNGLASTIKGGSPVTELNARNHARRLLDEASAVEKDEGRAGDSEIQWHLATARQECAEAAYVACSIDSQFVLSYAQALKQAENKTARQLNRVLETSAALPNYSSSPWAEAYFIHSLYNVQENNRTGDPSYLVSALKLQKLAAALKQNKEELARELASPTPYEPSATPSATPSAPPAPSPSAPMVVVSTTRPTSEGATNLFIAFTAVMAGVLVVAFVLARVTARKPRRLSAEEALEKLDEALVEGRITERTYERLRAKYSARLPRKTETKLVSKTLGRRTKEKRF